MELQVQEVQMLEHWRELKMSRFSTGSSPTKVTTLNDSSGSDSLEVKDSDGFTVAKIDSKGNLKLRGKVTRV